MDIYEKIDAALKEVERTRTRKPILDLLKTAWAQGYEEADSDEPMGYESNPYEGA